MKGINVNISDQPLSLDKAYNFIRDASCGGNCIFIGTVRNNNKNKTVTHLDFEAYRSMAEKEMSKIAEKAIEKYNLKNIAIHHREGHVGIEEIAVIIAVSSVHRNACFSACRYAIDTLKETVPIWKKEFLVDGNYWVQPNP